MKIDLIIPSYKPDKNFLNLIDEMAEQSISINKIIIMNTEQKYFDRLVYSSKLLDKHKNLEIRHISKREFDCGKARNSAVKLSDADYFLMMTQDVMPVGKELISKLLKPFEEDKAVAVSYARQVSVESAPEYVKYIRRYFFPEDSAVRSLKDVETLGWSAYIMSDKCALFRRDVFDEFGGFLNHVIAMEDVLYSSKMLNEGYKTAYVSDAVVVVTSDSEDTYSQGKAFDLAVAASKHPETFDVVAFKNEIKKLEKMTVNHLKRNGYRGELFSVKRMIREFNSGFKKGMKFKHVAYPDASKLSANAEYWRVDEILRDRNSVDVHSGYGRSNEEVAMLATPPVNVKKKDTEEQ